MSKYSIWKFPVTFSDDFTVEMPAAAKIISLQCQFEKPMMWAICNTEERKVKRQFRIYPTGMDYEDRLDKFIGTFQLHGGALVFHVFARCCRFDSGLVAERWCVRGRRFESY